jgi:hypothetical protein
MNWGYINEAGSRSTGNYRINLEEKECTIEFLAHEKLHPAVRKLASTYVSSYSFEKLLEPFY